MTKSKFVPQSPFFRGRRESATYHDHVIPNYVGNPLIEALPPILSKDEVIRLLSNYPEYDEAQRTWLSELRYHLIYNAIDFFQPLAEHIELERRFSRMIRIGYRARNPMDVRYWADVDKNVDRIDTHPPFRNFSSTATLGFSITGLSGVGKSTAVNRILSLYPQVIEHTRYRNQDFPWRQVVWLKIDCPHDGSTKGLCFNFFQTVDNILETNYYRNYARNGRATKDEMVPHMARVACIHTIGVLVIDEIQNLSLAKSGGGELALNFFVQLDNMVGLPIVKVGTPASLPLLRGKLQMARRESGQGDIEWPRLRKVEDSGRECDNTWQVFIESLWRYQYVQKPTPLSEKLSRALYDESQGIVDFAVKLYFLAQTRAIATGKEELTASIIRSVAADRLSLARPILQAIKEGNELALRDMQVDDVVINLSACISCEGGSDVFKPANQKPAVDTITKTDEPSFPPSETGESTNDTQDVQKKPRKKLGKKTLKGSLPELVSQAEKKKVVAYDALKQAGYIRDAGEFLEAEAEASS